MASFEYWLRLFSFLIWIAGWAAVSIYITEEKLKLQRSESILCGIWSSIIATGAWLATTLK